MKCLLKIIAIVPLLCILMSCDQGYIGSTSEERYMIFQSDCYVSDSNIAGICILLQIFV